MKKLRKIAALLMAAALAFGMGACSSDSDDDDDDTPNSGPVTENGSGSGSGSGTGSETGGSSSGSGSSESGSGSGTEKVAVTSVTVSGDSEVAVGSTITLTVTIDPDNATDSTVTWTSSNEEVATVSDGVVTGVKAGSAEITATAGGVSSSAYTVTVKEAAAAEEKVTVVMVKDGTADSGTEYLLSELSADDLPEGATVYSDSGYTTVVEDVSSVKAGDTIYVVYITGNQYLSGSSKWDNVDFDFSSYSNISSISITLKDVTGKGTDSNSWWFNAVTWNEETSSNVYEVIEWSGEINGYTVTITDADKIKAFSTYGLKITGNVFGSGNIAVTVTEKVLVTGITVSGAKSVYVGNTAQFTTSVLPADATDLSVTWSSSDSTVATVDENGIVTGVAEGTATITATAKDGSNISGSASITVSKKPADYVSATAVTISGDAEVTAGHTITLTAAVTPDNATDETVAWTSSDSTIATVSSDGVVTGVKAGTVTITATASGGTDVKTTKEITVNAATGDVSVVIE